MSATTAEVQPVLDLLGPARDQRDRFSRYVLLGHDVDVLVTGVGMVATAVRCSRAFAVEGYDLALNLGVCGSFRTSLSPGDVVHVASDCIAELGAEDGDGFLSIQQLSLVADDEPPLTGGRLVNAAPPANQVLASLPAVAGITVNTVHGRDASIACVVGRLDPDVESMEGAAFMYAALVHRVPFAQIRAVSNMVERRNRAAWKLNEAIANLSDVARRVLQQL